MGAAGAGNFDYEGTQAWRLALFFAGFGLLSVGIEHGLHHLMHYLSEKKMLGVCTMVNKLKDELMLLGFISLFLVLLQGQILAVCVPQCGGIWGGCYDDAGSSTDESRRRLGVAEPVECPEGEEQFISLTGLHQIHIFIFVLAVSLVMTGTVAMLGALGRLRTWGKWEQEHNEFDSLLDGDESPGSHVAAKWEALERSHSRRLYQSLWIPLFGADKVTFLYMRRFFIRKHNRSKSFSFTNYVTECTEDEFAQTLEIDGMDWINATLSVALREYFFTLWASCLSLGLSILLGIKLCAIARMFRRVTRDMATGQLTSRTPDCKPSEQEMKLLAAAKTAFDKADADSGGTLDREEVRDVLLELGCEVHAETDNEYFLEAFARFDVDDSGALEYDEFLQCYRFIQAHQTQDEANDEDGGGGLQAQSQTHWQTIRRSLSFGLRVPAKRRPDLKKGRVTWCCCNCGPQLDPNRLRPLVNFIIFQNAMAMAQVIFNFWQVGSSSEYFTEPQGIPGGMLLLQGSLFALQVLHTAFVLLPMFALVRQMGKHYNARLFGKVAGKAITEWAARSKKKNEATNQTKGTKGIVGKVLGMSPARLANKKSQYAAGGQNDQAESWGDADPRLSLATADDGNGNGPTASELLSQGKLPFLPPVPAPETMLKPAEQPQAANDSLPPVNPPGPPKAHPLGVPGQNP